MSTTAYSAECEPSNGAIAVAITDSACRWLAQNRNDKLTIRSCKLAFRLHGGSGGGGGGIPRKLATQASISTMTIWSASSYRLFAANHCQASLARSQANLIYRGLVKGYIAHGRSVVGLLAPPPPL
jgi:hypothetical protein